MDAHLAELLSLKEVASVVPGNRTARTIWKWATSGVNGVILETVCVGRSRFTSMECVERFIDGLTSKRMSVDSACDSRRKTSGRIDERTRMSLVAKGLLR